MVIVSHLFFFLWKKLVRGAAHMSRPSHYLELSISRQPLFFILPPIHPDADNKEAGWFLQGKHYLLPKTVI